MFTVRRRYRYDEASKTMVEIGADWTDTERRAPVATEELVYGKLHLPDGTDLSTRRRHDEYMKQNGLALASDYADAGPRAEKQRLDRITGEQQSRQLREAVERAAHDTYKKRRR